jgi:hypothetical protein
MGDFEASAMSNDSAHDDHIARLQRLLDRLEQVTKQASDLSQMAAELRQEAAESNRLVKATRESMPTRRAKRRRARHTKE